MPTKSADARELRNQLQAHARRARIWIGNNPAAPIGAALDSFAHWADEAAAALARVEALEKLVREMRDHLDVAIQFDHDDHGGSWPSTQWDFTAHELCAMADRLFEAAPGGSHGAGGNTEAAVQDSRPPAGRAEPHSLGQHPFPAPGVATPAPAGTPTTTDQT